MSQETTIKIHEVATDGLPDMDKLTGRVAFIFDGCIVSGWPLPPEAYKRVVGGHLWPQPQWGGNSDVANGKTFLGVTHWVEFPAPLWELVRP